MKRYTKEEREYEKEVFTKLGVSPYFYREVLVPIINKVKKGKCEECGRKKHLDVHHTDLKIMNIDTLKLICRKCHKKYDKERVIRENETTENNQNNT